MSQSNDSGLNLDHLEALANQPAPTVPADAFRAAVRSLMEKWHNDAVEAGFGTSEAAVELDELLHAHQPAQEQAEPDTFQRTGVCVSAGSARIIIAKAVTQEWADRIAAALAAQQEPVTPPK